MINPLVISPDTTSDLPEDAYKDVPDGGELTVHMLQYVLDDYGNTGRGQHHEASDGGDE